ncbi:unnamed protein product [Ambrosiozyma monospora]|uniref:Unnamed protein product n=1 Tax=Ambrosiozyma monospora TaxID=43982 RepID=A0ACB5T470_AMBMO|nr:unnamed protein product [Ambrosiozyma monospora]
MSELASSIPTSGGLYFWTYYYAPENYRVLFSYVIGLTNSMALCAGVVSVAYGNAEQILAAVYIQQDGNFEITSGKTYGIFAACVVTQCICTCFSSKSVATLQSISSALNTFLVILIFIAVPVGNSQKDFGFRGGKFIFGTVQNYSDWPIGFQFCLSLMTAVWSIGAFDSCVHMSEEAQNASFGVPIGILSSVSVVAYLSWFIIICLVACMKPDVGAVLETGSGFPFAQIIYDALGKKWTVAIMSLIAVGQWLCAASILTALSRQVWAFARDDGLPFSSIVKVVHPTLKVPIRAVLFATCVALALGCLCLAGSAAANALFSLTISGNYTAWCTPVLLRLTSGRDRFHPGPFYLGPIWSQIIGWITCAWGGFILVLCMFPSVRAVDKTDMNYTCVITGSVWIFALIYFAVYKRKFYHGPKTNLGPEDGTEVDKIPISLDSALESTGKQE